MQSNNSSFHGVFAITAVGILYETTVKQLQKGLQPIASTENLVEITNNALTDEGVHSVMSTLFSNAVSDQKQVDSALFMILSEPELYHKIKLQAGFILDSMIALSGRKDEFTPMQQQLDLENDPSVLNNRHVIFGQNNALTEEEANEKKQSSRSNQAHQADDAEDKKDCFCAVL